MSTIKISEVFVLIDKDGEIYSKLFLNKSEAEEYANSEALKHSGFKIRQGFI